MIRAADSDFLQAMAVSSRARDELARSELSDAQQKSQLLCLGPPAKLVLGPSGFDVIAELKKRSPAEGELDGTLESPEVQAGHYIAGGAAALSVLTEPSQFNGDLEDLHAIAALDSTVPAMRKDFLVSRYQVREARLAGASGVLLIAAMLEADQLKAMLDTAFELNMFALVEAFDQADLDKCVPVLEGYGSAIAKDGRCRYLLGVNCRNLRTLQVEFDHFARMASHLPQGMPWVAESGVHSVEQANDLVALGYRVALVGTALMRSGDPAHTVAQFRAAGEGTCL